MQWSHVNFLIILPPTPTIILGNTEMEKEWASCTGISLLLTCWNGWLLLCIVPWFLYILDVLRLIPSWTWLPMFQSQPPLPLSLSRPGIALLPALSLTIHLNPNSGSSGPPQSLVILKRGWALSSLSVAELNRTFLGNLPT
jgi:hypothetical protein